MSGEGQREGPRFLKAEPFPYLIVSRGRGWIEIHNELAGENLDDWLLTAWQAVKEHREPVCLVTSPSRALYLGPLGDSKASGTVPTGIAEYIAALGRRPVGFDWVALRNPSIESVEGDPLDFVATETVARRWIREGISRDPLGPEGLDELLDAAFEEAALLGDGEGEDADGDALVEDDDGEDDDGDVLAGGDAVPDRVDIPLHIEMLAWSTWERHERIRYREPRLRDTVLFVGYSPRQDQPCALAAWRPNCCENRPEAEEAYWKLIGVLPRRFVRGEKVVGELGFGFYPWIGDEEVLEITFPEPYLVSITQYHLDAVGAGICLRPVPERGPW